MEYRKFSLVNSKGQTWDLNNLGLKTTLVDPDGLGYINDFETVRYGEKLVVKDDIYQFPSVSGEIVFSDPENENRYRQYNQFVEFVSEKPLKLYYSIPTTPIQTYHIDCLVSQLKKTESKSSSVLVCSIEFQGLSFWQGETIVVSDDELTYTLNNEGDFPVGFEIEITGNLKNPYFTLEQDDELYGEAKFNDNSNNFSSVYVDSKDGEQNVVLKQDGSILPNPLAYQDLYISNGSVYVTFVKLEKGVSTLTIGDDNDSVSGYTIRFTPMYRSV